MNVYLKIALKKDSFGVQALFRIWSNLIGLGIAFAMRFQSGFIFEPETFGQCDSVRPMSVGLSEL